MKNIGIFTHDLYPYKPWGQGRYVYDLTKNVRHKTDRKIFIFSPSENINDELHIRIFPGSHHTAGKNITFSIKLTYLIERLIQKYHLGLVHFQGGPGGLFLFKRLSVPVMYTVHHTYFQQQKYIPSQKWKILLCLLEKYSYKKSDCFICVSPSTRNVLLNRYQVSSGLCTVIPNGVDLNRFYPLNQSRIPNSLFFVGRLEKRKGIDFLIKAIPRLKRTFADIKLYIAGQGVLHPNLNNYIKETHLEENVFFLGTLTETALHEWYSKVSIVVIPSVFEGFGITAIEAMASGTPVIATKVDGLKDVIADGENGLLVDYNDLRSLNEKIICLLKDKNKQKLLVKAAGKRIEEIYNWNKVSESILEVYNKTIS